MTVSPDGDMVKSATTESLDAPPAPPPHRIYRLGHPEGSERAYRRDENSSSSKSAEAMKNLDWRRRRDPGNSSESTGAATVTDGSSVSTAPTSPLKKTETTESLFSHSVLDPKSKSTQRYEFTAFEPFQHLSNESSDVFGEPRQMGATSKTLDPRLPMLNGGNGDLVEIVRHLNVPEAYGGGHNLKLIEVQPYTPRNGRVKGPGDRIVRIHKVERTLDAEPKQRQSSLQSQINEALAASKTTPRKIKPSPTAHFQEQSIGTIADVPAEGTWAKGPENKRSTGVERARNAVLADPAVIDTGKTVRRTRTSELSQDTAEKRTYEDTKIRDLHSSPQDPKFLKMLRKLQKGAQSKIKEGHPPLVEIPVQQSTRRQAKAFSADEAKRIQFKRQVWSSGRDSGLGSDMQTSESSGEATFPGIAQSNAFNPRAREFLSLNRSPSPTRNSEQPTSSHVPATQPVQSPTKRSPAMTTNSNMPPSNPTLAHLKYNMDAAATASGLGPMAVSPFSCPIGPEHLPYPTPTFKPTPSPGLEPNFSPPPFVNGFAPAPAAPFLSPALVQTLISTLQGLQQPQFQPQPALAPVQKPREPDPSNQQAYEAWIEWRKANEPGYAMECKMRQQRRIEKNGRHKARAQGGSV